MNEKQPRKPLGKAARILISLAVTLVFGLVYFYVSLPALNLQDGNFYTFVFLLCVVFVVASLFTSGFRMAPGTGIREYARFVKTQCLPVGILMVLILAVGLIGSLISMPIFRAAAYRDLLTVADEGPGIPAALAHDTPHGLALRRDVTQLVEGVFPAPRVVVAALVAYPEGVRALVIDEREVVLARHARHRRREVATVEASLQLLAGIFAMEINACLAHNILL